MSNIGLDLPDERTPRLFATDKIEVTAAALDLIVAHPDGWRDLLIRHVSGDWGEMSDGDRAINDAALRDHKTIVGTYDIGDSGRQIWIITQWDREHTLICVPED